MERGQPVRAPTLSQRNIIFSHHKQQQFIVNFK